MWMDQLGSFFFVLKVDLFLQQYLFQTTPNGDSSRKSKPLSHSTSGQCGSKTLSASEAETIQMEKKDTSLDQSTLPRALRVYDYYMIASKWINIH